MICCKECIELLYSYLEGELSVENETSLEDHFADVERIRNRRDSAHNLEEGEESEINSDETVVSDIPDEDGRYSLGIDKFSVEQNNF